jgi:hypothetical protein
MSNADDLITRAEALAGCRWDDPTNPNALYAIMGALAREMGRNPHGPKDDVVAGMLLMAEPKDNSGLAMALAMGLSPDDIAALFGKR